MTIETKDKNICHNDLQNYDEVGEEELAIDWTLNTQEIDLIIKKCRGGSTNCLRFATQVCWLKKTGRFIEDYSQVPIKAAQYLARQLECDPVLFISQPERYATERRYCEIIRKYLGFSHFDDHFEKQLNHWIEIRLQKDFYGQENLVKQAEEFLLSSKVILPTKNQLGKKVASLKKQAQQKIYGIITNKISGSIKEKFDQLLGPAPTEWVLYMMPNSEFNINLPSIVQTSDNAIILTIDENKACYAQFVKSACLLDNKKVPMEMVTFDEFIRDEKGLVHKMKDNFTKVEGIMQNALFKGKLFQVVSQFELIR